MSQRASGRKYWTVLVCTALVAAFALLGIAPAALAAIPVQTTFTLEGCNRPVGLTLPRTDGKFICPDANYTTGNLGSNWSELDLVPHRLTARIQPAQTLTVVIAADSREAGKPGYDQISVPELNTALSGPTCQNPIIGAQQQVTGIGSVDVTIVRYVTIPSNGNETCVYDWFERLALGSSTFPGNIKTQLLNENLTASGIGQKSVSITAGVTAQSLSKQIQAARGDGYLWSVSKTSVPSTTSVDTCATNPTGSFTTTVSWTRTPVTGDVTWTTQVFATNPSGRRINIQVTDVVSAGGTRIDTTTGPIVGVPALATNVKVLEHSGVAPAGTTTVSDVATGAYFDPDTGDTVPTSTTATASSPVAVQPAGNPTAQIVDTTSSTHPLALTALTQGTADVPLGQFTTSPITWRSGTVAQSGSVTLTFDDRLPAKFSGTSTVADQAVLTDTLNKTVETSATASVIGQPSPPKVILVKNVDVPPTRDATFFFSLWLKDQNGNKTTVDPVLDGHVTVPAGATSSASTEATLPPSPFGYIWEETPAPGYVTPAPGSLQPMDVCDTLDGTIANTREMGTIQVTKVVNGPTVGADPTATVTVTCQDPTYDQTLTVTPGTPVQSGPIPTGTPCTVAEPTPPPGYRLVSISPAQVVVAAGSTAVTVTNERIIGQLSITKVIEGTPAGASTVFTTHVDCTPGTTFDSDVTLTVTPPATSVTSAPLSIPAGLRCTVSELTVPAGWAVTSISPGTVTIGAQPQTVTISNTRVTGSLVVQKLAQGSPLGAGTAFTMHVACTDGFTQTFVLDVGARSAAPQVINGITSGASCTVTEDTPPAGWSLVGVAPNPVVIGNDLGAPATVTVTNQRDTGQVVVRKQVVGLIAGADQDFTVHLDCPGDLYDQALTLHISGDNGQTSATVDGLPTGIQCTVTEPAPPAGWTLTSVTPNPVTVSGVPAQVTVTNTRTLGALTVIKQLDGDLAGAGTVFTAHVSCPEADLEQDVTLEVTDGHSASTTLGGIPTGVSCTVTEPDQPTGWRLGDIKPEHVQITAGAPTQVTVTDIRETGGVAITKSLSGPIAGAPTTFSTFLDCDGTAYDRPLSLTLAPDVAKTVLADGIPTGTHCMLTETDIPPQWALGGIASNEITIENTDVIQINVVNVRVVGELHVTKHIDHPTDHELSFDLVLDCSDDLFDTAVPIDIPAGSTSTTESFSGIPTGVTCAVTEDAPIAGWTLSSIQPASVTIGTAPETVTVANTQVIPPTPTPTPTPSPTSPSGSEGALPGTGGEAPAIWVPIAAVMLVIRGPSDKRCVRSGGFSERSSRTVRRR